jgi:FAD/FMN-containing dehydrogenase
MTKSFSLCAGKRRSHDVVLQGRFDLPDSCYLADAADPRWLQKFERATDELLNACLQSGGSYYLTFDIIASKEQFQKAYPQWKEFFALKRKYDPQEMFSSCFYEKYAR